MPTIFTDTKRYSDLVKKEQWPEHNWCHEQVVVAETADITYKVGTVLGKVTATGKYKKAVETATDGSKVFAAVVTSDLDVVADVDAKLVVMTSGDSVLRKEALDLDATYDNDTKKNVVYNAMKTIGIRLATTV